MARSNRKRTGFAVALAWPQNYCKQAGAWYDKIMAWLGINKNGYYKVGHAALVLVDEVGGCHYFDFGRYSAPFKHGRVRSAHTDHDLILNTKIRKDESGSRMLNFEELLFELQQMHACHGEGKLHASYCPIDFQKAYAKAKRMNEKPHIIYGPFVMHGTNCSRFVRQIIRAGRPPFKYWLRLELPATLTPSPVHNVKCLHDYRIQPKAFPESPFDPYSADFVPHTIPAPKRHANIPSQARWLSGEGEGSWFYIRTCGDQLQITRYSPRGDIECKGLFHSEKPLSSPIESYELTYPSNCRLITLKSGEELLRFERIN
ncbi:MAG: DUF6695 family protein [Candidatus Woesearchaeota archaeon]